MGSQEELLVMRAAMQSGIHERVNTGNIRIDDAMDLVLYGESMARIRAKRDTPAYDSRRLSMTIGRASGRVPSDKREIAITTRGSGERTWM